MYVTREELQEIYDLDSDELTSRADDHEKRAVAAAIEIRDRTESGDRAQFDEAWTTLENESQWRTLHVEELIRRKLARGTARPREQ